MITKKLIKDVVTFFNNYLGYKNVVYSYIYYGKDYISVTFDFWALDKSGTINKCVGSVNKYIYNEENYKEFKLKVLEKFDEYLTLAKEQSYERT